MIPAFSTLVSWMARTQACDRNVRLQCRADSLVFMPTASTMQNDKSQGRGADGGARTRDRRVPADLRADSQATVPPTPRRVYILLHQCLLHLGKADCFHSEILRNPAVSQRESIFLFGLTMWAGKRLVIKRHFLAKVSLTASICLLVRSCP
ncbi:hypothetical protein PoB_001596700 [Plakobranchus ocellatus]|uniref:Uncharacterized protein n=1 Tax=Plakobranchus ocellatus TaxID=259542 RepID=A0AAV3Z2L5_9GAST|nr:hypothetical protein PoB_001596700 [Plakobranchus ocellatus]